MGGTKYCFIKIMNILQAGDGGPGLILGDSFMTSFYIQFDLANKIAGLAPYSDLTSGVKAGVGGTSGGGKVVDHGVTPLSRDDKIIIGCCVGGGGILLILFTAVITYWACKRKIRKEVERDNNINGSTAGLTDSLADN